MPIPRATWTQWRKAANVPQGYAKQNIGPLLDDYAKAKTWKEKNAKLGKLYNATKAYHAALAADKNAPMKAFAGVFDTKVNKVVDGVYKLAKNLANPLDTLHKDFLFIVADAPNQAAKNAANWSGWWNNKVRLVGTRMALVVAADKVNGPTAQKLWHPYGDNPFDAVGKANPAKACGEVSTAAKAMIQHGKNWGWW